MIPLDQLSRQTNQKSSWARLQDFQRRTAKFVKKQLEGYKSLKSIGYFSGTDILCAEANHFVPRPFPFNFSGPRLSLFMLVLHPSTQWSSDGSMCCWRMAFSSSLLFHLIWRWKEMQVSFHYIAKERQKKKKIPTGIISWHTFCPFAKGCAVHLLWIAENVR